MNLVRHLLFENPTSLWILLGLVAVAAVIVWLRTRSEKALWVAAGCFLVSVGLGILAWAVETDYEKVQRTLGTMAAAAESSRPDPFIERISAQYKNGAYGKEELAGIVAAAMPKIRITAGDPIINIEGKEATVQQTYTFEVQQGAAASIPAAQIPVTWEGKFAPDPDGEWRLRSAAAIRPVQTTPEEAARYLH